MKPDQHSNKSKIIAIGQLMRPEQWVKNVLVFTPAFFSGRLLEGGMALISLWCFVAFCLASSAVYCVNDAIDADDDRQHPTKCRRPVASRRLSKATAVTTGIICAILSLICAAVLCNIELVAVIGGYLLLNIAYCLKLKQLAIVDVVTVAGCFLLRLLAGSIVTDVALSPWIVIITFLTCLMLALGKRRNDLVVGSKRASLSNYSLAFIDIIMGALCACITLGYFLYAIDPKTVAVLSPYFYLSGFLVISGLIRYCQVVIVKNGSGSPTKLLYTDHFLQVVIFLWIAIFAICLYCR